MYFKNISLTGGRPAARVCALVCCLIRLSLLRLCSGHTLELKHDSNYLNCIASPGVCYELVVSRVSGTLPTELGTLAMMTYL
ncbi:hypothetical protein CYMTET_12317 [Cymbomonas tetramitiformis]|uniref:Uncharacterized protein n=1 Tax=Cymbomonas tetramitiformis TaxID=36881 RepID=A0AAE0GKR2_9CHLO|nr:hypothetical protein CYMTET_12317 [Cymbomonas tetramitiformis]